MKKIMGLLILICLASVAYSQSSISEELYVCTPCGYECDSANYKLAGSCSTCGMEFVKKSTVHFNNITFAEMCDRVKKNEDILLLDVRSPGEFSGEDTAVQSWGHLQNAININVNELSSRLNELEPYKNKEIIVYCSHSHRSPQATWLMTNNGFKNVTNVVGGVSILEEEFHDNTCLSELFVNHEK